MGLFEEIGKKIAADLKRSLLGGGNQNAGLQPIDRKSLQKQNRIAQAGDGPNLLSGGNTVPTYGIDTSKSYLENLYIMNNDEGAGGGLNGIPVPPTTGFKPAKYSPETRAYDQGEGEVYNAETGVREFTDGLNGKDPKEMENRLGGSVGADNTAKDEQQAREKINNVHKPFIPEGVPVFTDNPSVNKASDYNEYTSSNISKTIDQRRDEAYAKTIITRGDLGDSPSQSKLHGDVAGQPANVDLNTQPSPISPIHNGKERGSAKSQQDTFEKQYEAAIRKLNASSGVLNDIKHKSVIDQIAGTSERGTATRGYESKYTSDTTQTFEKNGDMRMPNYKGIIDGTANARIDKFNTLSVLKVPDAKGDKNQVAKALEKSDFIALYFHDLVNKKYIPFRAFINSMSDQFDATWNATNYLGRSDAVHIYGGNGRTFSIDFTAHAFGIEELHPMWQRINHLCGLTKPAAYTTPGANSSSSFIVPPMVKFNLGDLYKNQPALISSVAVTLPNEGNWELHGNGYSKGKDAYEYLNNTIKRDSVKSAKYPTQVSLAVSMTFLEKRLPKTENRHFGDAAGERVTGYDSTGADTKTYGESDFNEGLNKYPPNPTGF